MAGSTFCVYEVDYFDTNVQSKEGRLKILLLAYTKYNQGYSKIVGCSLSTIARDLGYSTGNSSNAVCGRIKKQLIKLEEEGFIRFEFPIKDIGNMDFFRYKVKPKATPNHFIALNMEDFKLLISTENTILKVNALNTYLELKRRASPNYRFKVCNLAQDKLLIYMGMSKPTFLKAVGFLKEIGLIFCPSSSYYIYADNKLKKCCATYVFDKDDLRIITPMWKKTYGAKLIIK